MCCTASETRNFFYITVSHHVATDIKLADATVNYFNERQSFQFDQLIIKISSTVCSNCVIFF